MSSQPCWSGQRVRAFRRSKRGGSGSRPGDLSKLEPHVAGSGADASTVRRRGDDLQAAAFDGVEAVGPELVLEAVALVNDLTQNPIASAANDQPHGSFVRDFRVGARLGGRLAAAAAADLALTHHGLHRPLPAVLTSAASSRLKQAPVRVDT